MSGFDRQPPRLADVIDLEAVRAKRRLPPVNEDGILPPLGKRRGDQVMAQGQTGTVIVHGLRGIVGRGRVLVLAVQFPDAIRVLDAAEVAPVSPAAAPVKGHG